MLAPLAELDSGEQNTRLNLAEILAGWKADYPDIEVDTLLLAGSPRDTVGSASADAQLLVVGSPYRGREWLARSVRWRVPYSIKPTVRSLWFRSGTLLLPPPTRRTSQNCWPTLRVLTQICAASVTSEVPQSVDAGSKSLSRSCWRRTSR